MTTIAYRLGLLAFFHYLAGCGVFSASGAETRPTVRVALMDLAVDDNSYRSAQTAANFTSLLQSELANESGVLWVERARLDLAKKELRLSEMDLLSGASDIRRGKWVKADWIVSGRFSLDDQSGRTLFLEITDLHHADVLASETVQLTGMAMTPMNLVSSQVPIVVAALRRLVGSARERQAQTSGQVVIAPLFFVDLRGSGPREDFEPLKVAFHSTLDQLARTNARFRVVRFPKAYQAMDEAKMLSDGLVEWDSEAWTLPADLYVWGTYFLTYNIKSWRTNGVPVTDQRTRHQISLQVWDGISAPWPLELDQTIPGLARLSVNESAPIWERLAKTLPDRIPAQKTQIPTRDIRRPIADSMVKAFTRVNGQSSQPTPNDISGFAEKIRLIETACFLDPDNQEAQSLRISSRWGSWIDYGQAVKNKFYSKWRRSNAWGRYVDRFGLEQGVPGPYVESLAEVIRMFPHQSGYRDPSNGFPNDMPPERIVEWNAQLVAELSERKRRVDAHTRPLTRTNEVRNAVSAVPQAPTPPAPIPPGTKPIAKVAGSTPWGTASTNAAAGSRPARPISPYAAAAATNRTPPYRQFAQRPITPASPWLTPTNQNRPGTRLRPTFNGQPWRRQLGDTNLFQLHPPNLWPTELMPAMSEIRFPAHFETKTILKVVPWRDQLVILAVDERSAPTSEENPDILAELLTKAGRLWTVLPDQINPKLLQAQGMPQSIRSFLIEKDRLWVAADVFGYLDLNDGSFHNCLAEASPDLPQDNVLAANGGKLYTRQHSGLSGFDPVSAQWNPLARSGARRLDGYGAQPALAANDGWLCYASGAADCYSFATATWTNVPSLAMIRCLSAAAAGFWIGGWDGLHFHDPGIGVLQSWHPPMFFDGLWDVYRPLNLKLLAESPGGAWHVRTARKETPIGSVTRYPKSLREPLRLDSHIPGAVTTLVKDGDNLWLGIADRLVLLDLPSRSLVACCSCAGKSLSSIGVSDEFVWVGIAYGDKLLFRVPKRDFRAVPKTEWRPLAITAAERQQLIAGMSVRDQAMYAYYAGDTRRVVDLLGNLNPSAATLEEMLLLAVTYDADNVDDPNRAGPWCERIITQYPDTPWSRFAQKTIEDSQENHRLRLHEKWLAKFDRNHDGVLDAAETRAREGDPEVKRELKLQENVLAPQLEALANHFDWDGDGKLGRKELTYIKGQVELMLTVGKIPVQRRDLTPLVTPDFPSVDTLLKMYDLNKDGGLSPAELKAFVQDIRK